MRQSVLLLLAACGPVAGAGGGLPPPWDAGQGVVDAGPSFDAGYDDGGTTTPDSGPGDAGTPWRDAGTDAGAPDSGTDPDAGQLVDAGQPTIDAGPVDAGPVDAGCTRGTRDCGCRSTPTGGVCDDGTTCDPQLQRCSACGLFGGECCPDGSCPGGMNCLGGVCDFVPGMCAPGTAGTFTQSCYQNACCDGLRCYTNATGTICHYP